MTGITNCRHENPSSIVLVPGSQCRLKTKTAEMSTVLANGGIEVVSTQTAEAARSNHDRSRMPASTPRPSDSGIRHAKNQKPKVAVFSRRRQTISHTGARKSLD